MISVARRMGFCGRHAAALSSSCLARSSNHHSYLLRCFYHRTYSGNAANLSARPLRVAIIGSGPAGFYAARRLLSLVEDVIIDMYERLPVPFGLVRFGVAPDHPEVKNCQATFTEVAESPRFNFIGNVHVGPQLPIQYLVPHYHALLFAYGASKDRKLGLQGEKDGQHIYSARAFVGWYNGLAEYRDLSPDLSAGEDAVIVGQGNVALDVARTLLTDVDALRKTDITEYALEGLSRSRIKNIHIVGRRGPVQAAFTIKEIREMMQLPNTSFRPVPESLFPPDVKSFPRPQRRLLELLKKGACPPPSKTGMFKSWSLDFLLLPHSLHWSSSNPGDLSHVQFLRTELAEPDSPTSAILPSPPSPPSPASFRSIPASTLFRSIGYKSEPLPGLIENGIPFDVQKGIFPNDGTGRIVSSPRRAHTPQEMTHEYGVPIPGLYCAGWVKRGPTGVIASTMADAFITADAMVEDWKKKKKQQQQQQTSPDRVSDRRFIGTPQSRGWEGVKGDAEGSGIDLRRVSWEDWEKIDAEERRRGEMNGGKPREKISSVEEMLKILD